MATSKITFFYYKGTDEIIITCHPLQNKINELTFLLAIKQQRLPDMDSLLGSERVSSQ